jgi:hypothetical protein
VNWSWPDDHTNECFLGSNFPYYNSEDFIKK